MSRPQDIRDMYKLILKQGFIHFSTRKHVTDLGTTVYGVHLAPWAPMRRQDEQGYTFSLFAKGVGDE